MNIRLMQMRAWQTSENHGFHNGEENLSVPVKLMLIVSEAAEALEEYRASKPVSYRNATKPDKPEGIAAELADIIIRVGDLAEILGFDLQEAVFEKMNYNDSRPFMHGGKKI